MNDFNEGGIDLSDEVYGGPSRPQKRPAGAYGQGRPGNAYSGGPNRSSRGRKNSNSTIWIIALAVEIVVFIALIILFFVLKGKIDDNSTDSSSSAAATEGSAEAGSGSSGGVNVESQDFTLTCTKVQLANDTNGNPAALIYFTFVNKTDTPLSMAEVFPPSLKQNEQICSDAVELTEFPNEYSNKDMKVSGGQSVECCFVFSVYDLTSPITLTIHDNYSTFTDIGSTEIPIS